MSPTPSAAFYTSFIQITATLGLFVSLIVIPAHTAIHEQRILQRVGLAPSFPDFYHPGLDLALHPIEDEESPIFASIKSAGMTSAQPLKDAFGKWENLSACSSRSSEPRLAKRRWYTASFTPSSTCRRSSNEHQDRQYQHRHRSALRYAFFTVFGAISDRIGRKCSCWVHAARSRYLHPIYKAMQSAAGTTLSP